MPDTHRTEADINVGEANPEEACPRPLLMRSVQAAYAIVEFVPHGMLRDAIEGASDEVPEGVASEDVSSEKDDVHYQNQASYADAEAIWKAEGHDCVVNEEKPDNIGEPQKIAMEILQDEREASLAEIAFAWFTHSTRRRISPERLIVRAAVVITRQAKEAWNPEHKECRGERQKARIPSRLRAQKRVRRVAKKLRRIKRRDIRSEGVVAVLKRRPRGVHDKRTETEKDNRWGKPPGIAARRLAELAIFPDYVGS